MKVALFIVIGLLWLLSNALIAVLGYVKTLKKTVAEFKKEKNCAPLSKVESTVDKKAIKDLKNFYTYDGTEQS